ncbi:MAG: glucuronate isomerase [Candidatus Accumulibacter sp.]|jgi:glucuronate isomerase|nr:glucuronate isomerase [Accumulibacter sp.]
MASLFFNDYEGLGGISRKVIKNSAPALRNLDTERFGKLGFDTAYDAVGDQPTAEGLASAAEGPNDLEVLNTTLGRFRDGSVPGKLPGGSAWWYDDHLEGMRRQMTSLADIGLPSSTGGIAAAFRMSYG